MKEKTIIEQFVIPSNIKLQIFENIVQLVIERRTFPICTRDDENTNRIDKYPRPINKPAIDLTIIIVSLLVTSIGSRKLFRPGVRDVNKPIESNKIDATRIIPLMIIELPTYKVQPRKILPQWPSKDTFLYNF